MKRDKRGWIRMAAVLALGAGLCITSTAQPMQAAEGDDGVGQRLSRMAEQIEIMRVVLTNAINDGAFGEQYRKDVEQAQKAARKKLAEELARADDSDAEAPEAPAPPKAPTSGTVTFGGDGVSTYYNTVALSDHYFMSSRHDTFTSYTRGFYSSGTGVLFTTEISAPVRQVKATDEPEQSATAAEDEWDRARAEALGSGARPGGLIWEVGRARDDATQWAIDEQYVELAVQGVIEAIAKHGLRLEGVADDESIIMAMRFSADRFGFTVPTVVSTSGDEGADAEVKASAVTLANVARFSGRVSDLNVVVDVPKSLLLAYDAGRMSMDELRRQATITSYSKAGRESVFTSGTR